MSGVKPCTASISLNLQLRTLQQQLLGPAGELRGRWLILPAQTEIESPERVVHVHQPLVSSHIPERGMRRTDCRSRATFAATTWPHNRSNENQARREQETHESRSSQVHPAGGGAVGADAALCLFPGCTEPRRRPDHLQPTPPA